VAYRGSISPSLRINFLDEKLQVRALIIHIIDPRLSGIKVLESTLILVDTAVLNGNNDENFHGYHTPLGYTGNIIR
jgi:hypothetical protein